MTEFSGYSIYLCKCPDYEYKHAWKVEDGLYQCPKCKGVVPPVYNMKEEKLKFEGEREKLIEELRQTCDIYSDNDEGTKDVVFEVRKLADFILARDKKIVEICKESIIRTIKSAGIGAK